MSGADRSPAMRTRHAEQNGLLRTHDIPAAVRDSLAAAGGGNARGQHGN